MKLELDRSLKRLEDKEKTKRQRLGQLSVVEAAFAKLQDRVNPGDIEMEDNKDDKLQTMNEIDDTTKLLYYDIDVLKEGTIYRKLNNERDNKRIATDKRLEILLANSDYFDSNDKFISPEAQAMLKSFILSSLSPISSRYPIQIAHGSSNLTASEMSSQEKTCDVDVSFDINLRTLTSFLQVNLLRKFRRDRQMQFVLLQVFIVSWYLISHHLLTVLFVG